MLWNMRSITRHKRSYGHPLHPDLIPDVLTCVLPLGTVSSGRESEVESAHLFLTIIQFFSACHLTSQYTSTCIHNSIISHSPTHYKSSADNQMLSASWFSTCNRTRYINYCIKRCQRCAFIRREFGSDCARYWSLLYCSGHLFHLCEIYLHDVTI